MVYSQYIQSCDPPLRSYLYTLRGWAISEILKQQIHWQAYHKFPPYQDIQKIAVIILKLKQCDYHIVMSPIDADGMANCVDPDQTAPLGTVWSGSTLFAQAYMSENLGSLRYIFAWLKIP